MRGTRRGSGLVGASARRFCWRERGHAALSRGHKSFGMARTEQGSRPTPEGIARVHSRARGGGRSSDQRSHGTRARLAGTHFSTRHARWRCECLPRKELLESWAVASRVRRRVRGRPIIDWPPPGAGTWMLLIWMRNASARARPRKPKRRAGAALVTSGRASRGRAWEVEDLRNISALETEVVSVTRAAR